MTLEGGRADVIELFGRYADIADMKQFEELSQLVHTDPYTMDSESITGTAAPSTSLNDHAAMLSGSFSRFVATHLPITGHVIDIAGDHATAHAHVRAEHWVLEDVAAGGPNRWLIVGFDDNEAVRTEHGRRFRKVELTAAYAKNNHLLQS
ncbi:nuclear transport factor 2 family protein [Brachybacterium sp.]|uniref:nuclear transport factor 2 family protein n=1 Tax=Brachybacterium sp. TaxID=1891286 RepID=UPI002ED21B99